MKFDLNEGTIYSKNLILDRKGNLSISGKVSATSGYIGDGVDGLIIGRSPEYTATTSELLSNIIYYIEVDDRFYSFSPTSNLNANCKIVININTLKAKVTSNKILYTFDTTVSDEEPSDSAEILASKLSYTHSSLYSLSNNQWSLLGDGSGNSGVYIAKDGIGLGNGNLYLDSEGSLKIVAEDGTTVSVRATDGQDGLKKGMQIIENFDSNGNPYNYSVYDANGYRRYINGERIQTYSVIASGSGQSYYYRMDNDSSIYYTTVVCKCYGNYWWHWATKFNDVNTTAEQRRIMFNSVITNRTAIPNDVTYTTSNLRYNWGSPMIIPVKKGQVYKFTDAINVPYLTITFDFDGAAIMYSGRASYSYLSGNTWHGAQIPLNLDYLIVSTMDV
jgi:hypothetical protein